MKRCFPWFFLILYVVVQLRPVFPVADYLINQKQIAQTFCENKNKPAMHCNGKCHLMKEMKKAAEDTPRNNAPRVIVENLLPHFSNEQVAFNAHFHSTPFSPSFSYKAPSSSSHPATVYHPPQC
jgi:hypothetical protein